LPKLTVVIVNYNAWDDVGRLVETLAVTSEVGSGLCQIVVVDNASDGPGPGDLAAGRPGVRLITRGENGGFAAGVNTGWRASRSPWVLVLNPDVVPGANLLGQVLEVLERHGDSHQTAPGIVGFALRNADGTRQPSVGAFPSLWRSVWEQLIPRNRRKYQAGWRTRSGPVEWVTGACVLLSSKMLDELAGMDEDFFLYYEEVALCKSAWTRGWRVEYDSSVEVVHLRPLQNRRLTPSLRVITRHSKLLYFRKHLAPWEFLALCRLVAGEAAVQGLWARAWRNEVEARSWRTVRWLAIRMRRGAELKGPDVRSLAEAVIGPGRSEESPALASAHSAIRPPTGRRGRFARWPQLRKDGPECR